MSKLSPFFCTFTLITNLQSPGHQFENFSTRRSSLLLYKVWRRRAVSGQPRLKRKRKQRHKRIKDILSHLLSVYVPLNRSMRKNGGFPVENRSKTPTASAVGTATLDNLLRTLNGETNRWLVQFRSFLRQSRTFTYL
jgi:hypothetical protein